MKRIVSVVAGLGAIAVLVAVGAGWVIGGKSEAGYHRALSRLGAQLPGVRLENEAYERGVFESRALTAVHLEEERVLFEHRISHPPGSRIRVETRLVPGGESSSFIAGQGLEPVPGTPLVTEIDLSGRSRSRYVLDAFDRPFGRGGKSYAVKGSGLELVLDLSADLKSGRGRFELPSLRISGDGALLEIEGVSSRFNSSDEQGLTVGQSRMRLESFVFELDQEPKYAAIAFKGLNMASRNGITEGFYGVMMQLGADEMLLADRRYGPLKVEIALERLPVGPLQRLEKEMEILSRSGAGEMQEAQLGFLIALGEIVPQILGGQPRLELKTIRLGAQQKGVRGSGVLTVGEGAVDADLQQQMASLIGNLDISLQPDLLQSLIMSGRYLQAGRRAGADARLDGTIAKAAGSTIEQLKVQNVLVEDGDALRLNLHFENLQLTLNGNPVAF